MLSHFQHMALHGIVETYEVMANLITEHAVMDFRITTKIAYLFWLILCVLRISVIEIGSNKITSFPTNIF